MLWVLLAAGIIALATFIGTCVGYLFKDITQKANDSVIGFSAGVMLCAAIFGLVEPSIEYGGKYGEIVAIAGIFLGAIFLGLIDRLMPKINSKIGVNTSKGESRALLLVAAIAIHHLPEGIAVGVSFGTGNFSDIAMVCGSIAIQNLPEAAVIIAPMLKSGISRKRAMIIALISGCMEIIGTFFGFFAVSAATFIMPFALAFAGGSMIYIIIDEMVPETHGNGFGRLASYSALAGFCSMLAFDGLISKFVS